MKEKINWEKFSKEAAEQLRAGKPLIGPNGVFSPLIKQVIEGEMDVHMQEARSHKSRRNGHTRKNVNSRESALYIFRY